MNDHYTLSRLALRQSECQKSREERFPNWAHAHRAEAAQLLDIEVKQIARMRMSVAQHGWGGIEVAHTVKVQALETWPRSWD